MDEDVSNTEHDLLSNLIGEFRGEINGEYTFEERSILSGGIEVDAVIRDSTGSPQIIIEVKKNSDKSLQEHALQQLKIYVEKSEAEFGILVSPGVQYGFSITEENGEYEYSYSTLDAITGNSNAAQRRPFQSYQELAFCYDHARKEAKRVTSRKITIENIVWELQRIATAEEKGISLDPNQDFSENISIVDHEVQGEISDLRSQNRRQVTFADFAEEEQIDHTLRPAHQHSRRVIHGVFRGYSIANTDEEILRKFVQNLTSRSADRQYSTPLGLSEYLVEAAGIGTGDKVLDPACGWGNLLREAERRGADGVGVDINGSAILTASGFNSLLNLQIQFYIGNGLSLPFDIFHEEFDHVVLDPPRKTSIRDGELPSELPPTVNWNSTSAFIASSLAALKPGGLLTTIAPTRLLTGAQHSKFREYLIDNYKLERVAEVKEGSVLPTLKDDMAIIQVSKDQQGQSKTILEIFPEFDSDSPKYNEIEKSKLEVDLDTAKLLGSGTLSPVEIQSISPALEQIRKDFSDVQKLSSIPELTEITRGAQVSEEEISSGGGNVPYLRIKTVSDSSSPPLINAEQHPTAGPNDVLISATGTVSKSYLPDEKIVPDQNWAVLSFNSKDAALVYHSFFNTPIGSQLLEAISIERTIPYIPLLRLEKALVPIISEGHIEQLARKIRQIHRSKSLEESEPAPEVQDLFLQVIEE